MDTTEVLSALEAELRALDTKRAELAKAIETIRRIIVIGNPATQKSPDPVQPSSPVDNLTLGEKAEAHIKKVGRPVKAVDIAKAIGDPNMPRNQYGAIFKALQRRETEGKLLEFQNGWGLPQWAQPTAPKA